MKAKVMGMASSDPRHHGLIHGDFIPVNLFDDAQVGITLFDFDFCGLSHRAYDLASLKWALPHYAPNLDEATALYGTFLESYRGAGGVQVDDELVEAFVPLRQLWVWGTNVECGEDFRRLNPHSFRKQYDYFMRFLDDES